MPSQFLSTEGVWHVVAPHGSGSLHCVNTFGSKCDGWHLRLDQPPLAHFGCTVEGAHRSQVSRPVAETGLHQGGSCGVDTSLCTDPWGRSCLLLFSRGELVSFSWHLLRQCALCDHSKVCTELDGARPQTHT